MLLCILTLLGGADKAAAESVYDTSGSSGTASESGEISETGNAPFDGTTDMKSFLKALEIIGATSVDNLTESQLEQLEKLGFDQQFLDKNKAFIDQLTQENASNRTSDANESGYIYGLWPYFAGGAAGILIITVSTAAFIRRRRKRRT